MSYVVEKRELDKTQYLYMERDIQREEIPQALAEMFGAVFQFATSQGIEFAGPPTACYPGMGAEQLTLRAGMPVLGATAGEGDILLGSLGGGSVATTLHKGPYDTLHEAHSAIESWLSENSEVPGGAPSEVYVTDPGEVPDPAEWVTEVNWPLRGRAE